MNNQNYRIIPFTFAELEAFHDGNFGFVIFTFNARGLLATKAGPWSFHKDQQDIVDQLNAIEPDKRGIRYAKVLIGDGDKPYIKSIEGVYWEA